MEQYVCDIDSLKWKASNAGDKSHSRRDGIGGCLLGSKSIFRPATRLMALLDLARFFVSINRILLFA
jgi:hypothetical protein